MASRRSGGRRSSRRGSSKGSGRKGRGSRRSRKDDAPERDEAAGGEENQWFSRGADSLEKEKEDKKGQYRGGGPREFDPRRIFRWFIPNTELGEPKEVLFLESDCLNAWMHHFKNDGRWGNWETCPRLTGMKDEHGDPVSCPLCDKDDNVSTSLLGHYTILDVTGWDGGDGHRMGLKILPAKEELVNKLARRRDKFLDDGHDGLFGALFTVVRDTKDSDNCGNDWAYEEHVDVERFLEDNFEAIATGLDWFPEGWFWEGEGDDREYWLGPFKWMDIVAPRDPAVIADIIGANYDGAEFDPDDLDVGADDDDPGY